MKIFIYKSLIVFFLFLLLFEISVSRFVRNYEAKIDKYLSKEGTVIIKNKIRDEISSSIDKERILSKEDALLIRKFLNKINKELNVKN
ncbi:MAG: hypothetical protein CBD76_01470 [Pelagibacteraceae bacterium TMED216]|nr:MAG: hypothetical protein CBD76_01470 [Pelagibacteraceae bacterium TMED216]|tara:strand:- start:9224 stop:9487 length:264 start_codon:yes stop_codon:yes gene_type:complete